MLFAAGTTANPSRLYIRDNSATSNYEGVGFFGDSIVTEHLDMGANSLEDLPYPINPGASQMGNHIDVEFAGNDVSNNFVGLRYTILGGGRYPYSQTGYISANVHHNRFIDNTGFPFAVDQGLFLDLPGAVTGRTQTPTVTLTAGWGSWPCRLLPTAPSAGRTADS